MYVQSSCSIVLNLRSARAGNYDPNSAGRNYDPRSAQIKMLAANDLFCYFNRHIEGYSAECKTLEQLWSASSATDASGGRQSFSLRLPAFQQTLKALEKHTAAGPMLEAWEAESLCTVPLKPYQSQSVQFMSEAEHNKRGMQSAFWLELSPGNDASKTLTALFSPVSGEIIVDSATVSRMAKQNKVFPPASHGGFLFEAMGLGKTVEMIALCTKNPPPPAGLPLRLTIAELAASHPAAATGEFLICSHSSYSCNFILFPAFIKPTVVIVHEGQRTNP